MPFRRFVMWLTETSWAASVDAAAGLLDSNAATEVVLLYVIDSRLSEAAHGAFRGLLGRGSRQRHPGATVAELTKAAAAELLTDARGRLGHRAELMTRTGRVEREVVTAAAGADLLICARDGTNDVWARAAWDTPPGSSSTMPRARCC
jgi:hypothetical protein